MTDTTYLQWATLFVTQFVMLCGIVAGLLISYNNSRSLAEKASKDDVHEVKELVNGKTAKLEKMIADKAFKAGVAEGEKK